MDAWLVRQQKAIEALVGSTVSGWDGVEMALREESPIEPQFTDPDVHFLQLAWVRFAAGSEAVTISNYQDNGYFGLYLVSLGRPTPEDCYGIFRWRALDLPTGRVDAVDVLYDAGTLARIAFTIEGRTLLLVAGEVYETMAATLEVHRLDESVLVFTSADEADKIHWM